MSITEQGPTWDFEVVNVEQAGAWDGEDGDSWTTYADHFEAASRRFDPVLIEGAGIGAADRVLDIGCGTGVSTREAARTASDGEAVGIDLSSRMLEEARRRSAAESITNARFVQGDAQVHPFEAGAFDVAVSRFGAMFFANPVAAFANIRQALRPGGRLAMLSWQVLGENPWVQLVLDSLDAGRSLGGPPPGTPGPFGLAEEASVQGILAAAGFDEVRLEGVHAPLRYGSDTDDAFAFVSDFGLTRGLLDGLDASTQKDALDRLRAALAAHATTDGVLVDAAAWLTTARRSSQE